MRLPMILAVLLFAVAAFLTLAWWQQSNVRVRQQALQLRINALKNAQEPQEAPSPSDAAERQSREQRLNELQWEFNAGKARGASVK